MGHPRQHPHRPRRLRLAHPLPRRPRRRIRFRQRPAELPDDTTPFDIRGVELSHHHGDCSFETILRRYELTDPVLWKIAEIIHEADLDNERYNALEAPGLDITLRGLSMICTDQQTITHTTPTFDGFYEYYRRATLLGHEPA
jgi:hypothetical protein